MSISLLSKQNKINDSDEFFKLNDKGLKINFLI